MRIGLTGGIGSGKSTVAAMLAELGALIVDTDAISRALTAAGGAALPLLAAEFGPGTMGSDGALDRARMRDRVFKDPGAKQQLEAILHPLISAEAQRAAALAAPGQTVVYDVPLLTESAARWRRVVDRVLVVDCSPQTQVERVQQRSGWPRAEVERVIAQQAPREARLAIADAVIDNDRAGLAELRAQVLAVWQRWHPTAAT